MKDTEVILDKFEEAIPLLETKYKREGKQKDLKKAESNGFVIQEWRRQTFQLAKEDVKAI